MVESSITDVESQAAAGDRSAQISMARTLLDAGQTEAGRNWLRRAAESGPPDIKLALGEQLIANPPYEVAEALHWTHAAAEEGSAEAAHRLAVFAAEGIGEPQSWSGCAHPSEAGGRARPPDRAGRARRVVRQLAAREGAADRQPAPGRGRSSRRCDRSRLLASGARAPAGLRLAPRLHRARGSFRLACATG